MALIEVILPRLGESVMEATINTWLKQIGDSIEEDEALLEVSTDKVDTEIPSTHSGIIKEILIKEGETVQVGTTIATIAIDGEPIESDSSQMEETNTKKTEQPKISIAKETTTNGSHESIVEKKPELKSKSNKFYSPLVKNIAQQESISIEELDGILGSGKDGRVTKKDILNFIEIRTSEVLKPEVKAISPSKVSSPVVLTSAGDEIIEMDRMRKIISQRMIETKQLSAHVQSFTEADLTTVVRWRNKVKDEFFKATGEKLTYTPIFLEAIVQAIRDFPLINSSVDGDKIIRKKDINIGMAAALPNGNLIVPVIRNADQLSLAGLTRKVNDLAKRARENALLPDELTGGTYTVTNVGVFGSVMGTPLIVQPQVAILALGAIQKKPAVIETEDGDVIGIRHKMFLSHSYDHRIIDGMLGSKFAQRVADYLGNFDFNRSI